MYKTGMKRLHSSKIIQLFGGGSSVKKIDLNEN